MTTEDATIVERPRTGDTRRSPEEALRDEEVVRTRRFLLVVIGLVLTCGPLVPLVDGDETLRGVLLAALLTLAVVNGAFVWIIRDPSRYTPERALVPILVCVVGATTACLFVGMYSGALALYPFGIYFFSLGASFRASAIAYGTCAVLVGVVMLLQITDVVPDRGLISAAHLPVLDRTVLALVIQLILAATFWFGRLSRRATIDAFVRLDRARAQVRQREALLEEANRDLDRALMGGHQGRFSGAKLGPWFLGEVIGRGAMGEVYRATDAEDRDAAVKILERGAAAEPTQLRRFLREAEIMSQLESPHVVKVLDVARTPADPPWIAMELLEGHDLAWHLRKRRRLTSQEIVRLVRDVADALERAREADIVHRDLKPQNVFGVHGPDGHVVWKVLDFGVSKLGFATGTLTSDHVIGTPGYLAPEQATADRVDHRADVFSLAAVAYRALTGRPPFRGDDMPKVLFATVYSQPARPSQLADLPEDVDLVLALGLAKKPEDRPATATAFADALEDAVEKRLSPELRDRARTILAALPYGR